MSYNLSPEDKEYFESLLAKAEPYDDDDPVVRKLDGEGQEHARTMDTIAKGFWEGRLR